VCGIAGIVISKKLGLEGADCKARIGRMVARLAHRGPDDSGVVFLEQQAAFVTLGHTRLSILDLSSSGHQPMGDSATGNVITFNGEIYNYLELRKQLGGNSIRWRSQTDTETILRSYETWKLDSIERLRGMFAFGLWDAVSKSLLLVRDRLGIKPLYYYKGDGFFAFASEIRALLATEMIPRSINAEAVWNYLAYQTVPGEGTMIRGIRLLPPGAWMRVDLSGKIAEGRYWNLLRSAPGDKPQSSPAQVRKRTAELLAESVSLHLISDVPVGVFLSGGIDSSAIVAAAARAQRRSMTFSVKFTDGPGDESMYARMVAEQFTTDHTEIPLSGRQMLDQLPDALSAMDHPSADALNTFIVSKAVRFAGVKVALSGLGGDELFGGYPSFRRIHRWSQILRMLRVVPEGVLNCIAAACERVGSPSDRRLKIAAILRSSGRLAQVLPVMRQLFPESQRKMLVSDRLHESVGAVPDPCVELVRTAEKSMPSISPLALTSFVEMTSYMHDLLLRDADQMTMAHGLEARVPLLDHKVVEHVFSLPDRYRTPGATPKALLVESIGFDLPMETVRRPKQGFKLPFDSWMRRELMSFCEERLAFDRVAHRGLLNPLRLQSLWSLFKRGDGRVSWSRIWACVVLEEWLTQNGVDA
jgi:asparagine synthase (glutamine-hydrolysing)